MLHRLGNTWIVLAVICGAVSVAAWFAAAPPGPSPSRMATAAVSDQPANRPAKVLAPGYVSSDACLACHAHQHATWHASYHRTMTQVATPESVVADFNDVTLHSLGQTYHLTQEDGRFFVEMDDPEWAPAGSPPPRVKREIVLTTGSHHEQDFWFETIAYNRLINRFPFVYRIEEQQWIQDHSVLLQPPESHTGFDEWNKSCIRCHATMGRPRLKANETPPDVHGPFDSQVVEFGIACEACHGPGETHVLRHATASGRLELLPTHLRPPARDAGEPIGPDQIVNPAKLDARRSSQICGQCHSFFTLSSDQADKSWAAHGFRFRPGEELTDRILIESRPLFNQPRYEQPRAVRWWLENQPHYLEERFWSDGVVRILGREYTAMIDSPCFQGGALSCLSCHTMHPGADDPRPLREWANDQLKLGMESNEACLQCHQEKRDNLSAHTHHPPDSDGSRCYNCHMPPTAYGLLKATHTHTVENPSVAASLATGRPNGCNLCHLDKSWDWTNRHLADWFGRDRVEMTDVQAAVPASAILVMNGEAGQRALIAWAMGWPPAQKASGTDWLARFLAPLLDDPYDAVRFVAARSLRTLDGFHDLHYDFLSEPPERTTAHQRVRKEWGTQREARGQSVDLRELIDDAGDHITPEIFDTLLQQRDDRRVLLME
ncbi:MAG: hypothetical protein KF861_10660 [Planctomycetaceae bacterium]|nr:hypothetical protein [Planctomycetaceae bacterium]